MPPLKRARKLSSGLRDLIIRASARATIRPSFVKAHADQMAHLL